MDKTIFLIYGGKKSWVVPKKLFTSVIFDLLNQGSLQLIDRRLYLRASTEQSGHGSNRETSPPNFVTRWLIIFGRWIVRGLSCWFGIPCGSPTISEILLSTTIKTLWPARTTTSFKNRWIGAYSKCPTREY